VHNPVLLNEVISLLDPQPGKFIIDGTADGGGHAEEILKRISPQGTLLALDWDEHMVRRLRLKLGIQNHDCRVVLRAENYACLAEVMKNEKLPKADGLILDLGFSSEQVENSGRGFSFLKDEPLYMVYDPEHRPVKTILKELTEIELADVIYKFSGERYSRRIAKAIKERIRKEPIETSGELAKIIRRTVPGAYERGRINPATRTFQALRIYANDELGNLQKIMKDLPKLIAKGGRVAVISFHSLEDKIVKEAFKELSQKKVEVLTKKPLIPSRSEIIKNPRSRSAKLRAVRFL